MPNGPFSFDSTNHRIHEIWSIMQAPTQSYYEGLALAQMKAGNDVVL
jgi:hypothetical protein